MEDNRLKNYRWLKNEKSLKNSFCEILKNINFILKALILVLFIVYMVFIILFNFAIVFSSSQSLINQINSIQEAYVITFKIFNVLFVLCLLCFTIFMIIKIIELSSKESILNDENNELSLDNSLIFRHRINKRNHGIYSFIKHRTKKNNHLGKRLSMTYENDKLKF